jgi:hypothetical protein
MSGRRATLALYARTLRHLRPQQIAWRLLRMVRRRLPVRVPAEDRRTPAHYDGASLQRLREFLAVARAHGLDADADPLALRDDIFTFLGQSVDCEARMPWQDKSVSRLWRYQLHGFRTARMLAATAFSDAAALGDAAHAARWVEDWRRHNPPGADVAWDSHPTSERLFNWVLSSAAFGAGYGATAARCTLQAVWLEARIEYDLCANHVLKEVMALALVAEVTGNAALRRRAWAMVEEQVSEQTLPDGGHYERSPMYHAQALFDGLVLHAASAGAPAFFDSALRRMTHFLEDLLHPDGDIPLFSDAAFGETMPGGALVRLSHELLGMKPREETRPALLDSGFFVLGSGADRMILKAAGPSPAYQPGHAHADPFSFELSVAGQRMIVDGGCHGYAESPLRGYCRSVRAHNTVCINGEEPMEAWDVFRVGRRYQVTAADWEMSGHASTLRGVCRWPQGWTHARYARYDRDTGFWAVVDRVDGGDPLAVESCLHFHPGTELTEKDGFWIATRGEARLGILPEGADRIERIEGAHGPDQGWYCPRFGAAEPAPTLVLHAKGAGRLSCGWMLFPPEGADRVVAALEAVRMELRQEG